MSDDADPPRERTGSGARDPPGYDALYATGRVVEVGSKPYTRRRRAGVGSSQSPSRPKSTSAASPRGGSATHTVTAGVPKSRCRWAKRCRELYGMATPCARSRR
jgi:hypothetical protein